MKSYAETLMDYEDTEVAIATAEECCEDSIEDDWLCKVAYFFADNSIFVVTELHVEGGFRVQAL